MTKWEYIFLAASIPLWALAAAVSEWLNRKFPLAVASGGGQIEILETLRGLAAFFVFCAHVTMYFRDLAPGSRASSYLGDLGVIIFFMLTGFLFWDQVLSKRISFETFFKKRVLRLAPLCVFVVFVVTAVDWVFAGFPRPTFGQLQSALHNFGFGFLTVQDVFGPDMQLRINTIWSLRWEWCFYLVLPLLAIWPTYLAVTLNTLLFVGIFYDFKTLFTGQETDASLIVAFYLGALCTLLTPKGRLGQKLTQKSRAWLAAAAMAAFVVLSVGQYFLKHSPEARVRQITFVLTAALFFTIFPLLGDAKKRATHWFTRGTVLLGKISYSLYLWQLFVIYYFVRLVRTAADLKAPWVFAAVSVVLTFVIVIVSHFSFRYIELRFAPQKKRESDPAVKTDAKQVRSGLRPLSFIE